MLMIIMLYGEPESGKDYAYEIIHNEFKNTFRLAFADKLKEFALKCGWNGEKDVTGRAVLQAIGEFGRMIDENFWVSFIDWELERIKLWAGIKVITDFRYPNEYNKLHKNYPHIFTIKIIRENHNNELTEEQKKHKSETALNNFKFDYVIINKGDETFKDNIIKTVNKIKNIYDFRINELKG